ncbi:hypothetical protein BJX99DRAFT_262457 [Aspergillus californicus]
MADGSADSYSVFLGIHPETADDDAHYALILRSAVTDPAGDCIWYHTLGGPFEEIEPYRRVKSYYRRFQNPYFPKREPIGMFRKEKFDAFEAAFYSTPPQKSHWFITRVIRKLGDGGILAQSQVDQLEIRVQQAYGTCPEGLVDDPFYLRDRSVEQEGQELSRVFHLEL